MELTAGIRLRAARMGQMLAFLAALFLAVAPHGVHAQSGEGAGHSHFGIFCDALDTETSPAHGQDGTPSAHGDCLHHIDSMVRPLFEQSPDHVSAATEPLYEAPLWQLNLTADPPPPRTSS